jgi:putative DNA primase/helicase
MHLTNSPPAAASIKTDRAKKPPRLSILAENIPTGLRALPRWLGWRWEWHKNKWTKPPVCIQTDRAGSSTNPATWCDFATALAAAEAGYVDGIGFALGNGFCGIDFDGCRDRATGKVRADVLAIVARLGTYGEVSPSGEGVKLILRGTLPPGRRAHGPVEMYDRGRYFTVTGHVLDGCPSALADNSEALAALHHELIAAPSEAELHRRYAGLSDRDLAVAALAALSPKRADSYHEWLLIGMALHATDASLLDEWDRWSRSSKKYTPGCCAAKWRTFNGAAVGLGSLIFWARQDSGWSPPRRAMAEHGQRPQAGKADPATVAAKVVAASLQGGQPRLRHWRGTWWSWRGGAYREVNDAEVRAGVLRQFEADYENVKSRHVSDVIEHLRAKVLLPSDLEPPCWLGDAPHGWKAGECLATRSQVVHLPSLVARREPSVLAATPSMFALNALDYDLNLNAPRPERWLRFLDDLWPGDQQSIATLQEMFGYLLLPDTRLQKIFVLIGPRRSGKSTIMRVLAGLVGKNNVCAPTLSGLGTNFGLWPLIGKSVGIIADARLSRRADLAATVERLLSISGEDLVNIDRKCLEPVMCKLQTRFVLITNELPKLQDVAGALSSRLVVLATHRSFLGAEDHDLTERLLAEKTSILWWAIEGWRRLRQRGRFVQPASADDLLSEFAELTSPVLAFIQDRCVVGPNEAATVSALFEAWKAWCQDHGRERLVGTTQSLARDLRAVLPAIKLRRVRDGEERVRRYEGVGLREAPIPP